MTNELVNEGNFGRGERFELIEVVGDDRQCDVVIEDEAIKVGEGVEAMIL